MTIQEIKEYLLGAEDSTTVWHVVRGQGYRYQLHDGKVYAKHCPIQCGAATCDGCTNPEQAVEPHESCYSGFPESTPDCNACFQFLGLECIIRRSQ